MSGAWEIKGVRPLGGDPTTLYVEGGELVGERPAGAQSIDADGLIALPGL
ncbi:MAG: dihydroorotase, partial [Frankiaceae bacterium]|nr:dihydroorotase [Frankiaceae bacterium]